MSNCIEKLPHKCGSSDALQVFEQDGKYSGYCFSCGTYEDNPYADKDASFKPKIQKKSQEEIEEELIFIASLSSKILPARKLNAETLLHFNVKVGLSEQDGETPTSIYFPKTVDGEITGYKARLLENKKMFSVGTTKGADLFGWTQAIKSGAKRLYLTEGEYDALACYQALKKRSRGTDYADNIPAVVSLNNGAGSIEKALSENATKIREYFKELVLVMDTDEAGREAANKGAKIFPGCMVVTVPGKDPNECLIEGREKALANALLFSSDVAKNSRTVSFKSVVPSALAPVPWGLSFPFPSLTEMTRGLRFGETYYFGAGVKMGKSELADTMAAHFVLKHKLPVFCVKPEQSNQQTVKKISGKAVGKVFHDPKIEYDPKDMAEASVLVEDYIHLLNKYQHVGWSSLKQDIYDSVNNLGVKLVIIDPITNLTNGIAPSEADTILKGVAQDLAAMALDLDISVMLFCHLIKPETGPSHERGGKVYSHQFAGSRGMMRSCNYMLGLEGNKDPELETEERNIRKIVMLEDREFGTSGIIPLYWDENTQLFNEIKER